jgi:RNA polymerase sigma-70 factor (ECF subfamily)
MPTSGLQAPESDEDLMLRVQQGDVAALGPLYDRFAGPLLGYLFHTVGDSDAAQDLLHDVFLSLIDAAGSYEHPRPVKPWLFTIARNRALNYLKKARPRVSLDRVGEGQPLAERLAGAEKLPGQAALESESRTRLLKALDLLGPGEKEVVVLRLGQGLRYREIGEATGLSEEAVRQRMSRAIKKLRESAAAE